MNANQQVSFPSQKVLKIGGAQQEAQAAVQTSKVINLATVPKDQKTNIIAESQQQQAPMQHRKIVNNALPIQAPTLSTLTAPILAPP